MKWPLSTVPFLRSVSYCEVTSPVTSLEALIVGAISGSTPILTVVSSYSRVDSVGRRDLNGIRSEALKVPGREIHALYHGQLFGPAMIMV